MLLAMTLLLQGSGMGLFQVANMDFVMGSIARHQQGVAGSLTMLTRTVGVVGGATLGSLVFGQLQLSYTAQLQVAGVGHDAVSSQAFLLAFHDTFWWAAALAVLAWVLLASSRCALAMMGHASAVDTKQTHDTE
jgi:hypothetical protein